MQLAYRELGSGPPVLLIHGLAADAQAWDPVAARLSKRARVIAYDRRGYGASGAPDPYESTTVYEQTEDAATLLKGLGATPALLGADGFGALVALDLLLRHRELVSGAVLSHPPLFAFVASATEVLSAQREQLLAALGDRGPEAAVESWLGGRAAEPARARARAAHRAFFADFAGLSTWPVTRAQLRSIDAPMAVLTAETAPPHILAAADALAALAPRADRRAGSDIAAALEAFLPY